MRLSVFVEVVVAVAVTVVDNDQPAAGGTAITPST
jgi:hypothetical protein